MEINVDPKAVEQAVADAIIKSALGAKIEKAVHDLLTRSFDNPLDKALYEIVKEVAIRKVREGYSEKIEAFLKEKLTDENMRKITEKFWSAANNFDR